MSNAELLAQIAELTAANAVLRAAKTRALSYKVSVKGGVSVYGMGRFPVTQYKEQWLRILDDADKLRAFIKANDSKLKAKGDATTEVDTEVAA